MPDLYQQDQPLPKRYIGTKTVIAEAMTRAAWCAYRGWTLPVDENGTDDGYLVEYQDGGKPNMPGRAGYVSWTPKEQFDNAYRPCEAMTFGLAIEALKRGQCVARAGWNGKGQFVLLIEGSNKLASVHGFGFGEYVGEPTFGDTMFLRTVDNRLIAWTPSQSDTLSEDWRIVGTAEQPVPIEDAAIEQEIQAKGLIKAGALRQFRHNDGSEGFVFAYDKAITDREFGYLSAQLAKHAPTDDDPATRDDYRRMFNRCVGEMIEIAKALSLPADGQSHEQVMAAIKALVAARTLAADPRMHMGAGLIGC